MNNLNSEPKMLIIQNVQDLFDQVTQSTTLTLPAAKANPIKIKYEDCNNSDTVYENKKPPLPFINSEVFHAKISSWRCLTAKNGDCKVVYEFTFNIEGSNFQFHPGDTIGIIPRNVLAEVNFLIDHLELNKEADQSFILSVDKSVKGAKIPPHIPVKSSLRKVLTECVDIRCIVKKLFILALSAYTTDDSERKALEYLCSKEGRESYNTYILNKNTSFIDLLATFKSCKPPVEVILAHLPRLLPRPFSILNSPLKNPYKLKVCFSIMDIGYSRKGLTTGWLESLISNENIQSNGENIIENGMTGLGISEKSIGIDNSVPMYMRKNVSHFSLPEDIQTPLLLLGPGTGVAPFIGFLEDRELLRKSEIGKSWLYFGCRNPDLDFVYRDELNNFLSKGVLSRLCTAFSRVEGDCKYIQDALLRDGEDIVEFIESGANVYICGDLNTLTSQIKETLVKCFVLYGEKSAEEAEKYIVDMQKENRYLVDMWS